MVSFAKGTGLSWNGHTIAELTSVGNPELSIESIDTTTHQTTGRFREFMSGLVDAGEVAISGYFDATDTTGQQAMFADAAAGTERQVIITGPSSIYTFTFSAFITKIKLVGDAPIDKGYEFSASIKITGEPVFAISTVTGMSACGFSNDVLMMPTFAIGTYEYVVTVTHGETSTVVTPVDSTSGEIITITSGGTSQVVATGVASSAITLSASAMTDISIVISAANKAPKTYIFHVAVLAA